MLKVHDLVKRYVNESGERKGGISGVSFDVREGELFTLLGPSGCGKTTTLRSIAGLEQPDSGRISLGGRTLFDGASKQNVPMYGRDIGMVFQSYAIWPHMNVFENAAYPLRARRDRRMDKSQIRERVMRVLEMVGLVEFHARSATKLSGGQQQRLALARALVREPSLLLLDEPLSNLDALLREHMRTEIKRLQTEWGVTAIYVTHDQSEAMALSDRVAVLNDAEIIQIGTPVEIYNRPTSAFVANFIGRTNLFHGKVRSAVTAGSVAPVETELGAIRCHFASSLSHGGDVTFVIRPENVKLQPSGTLKNGHAINAAEGRILSRVFLGEIAEYTIDLDGHPGLIARVHPSTKLGPDDRVQVVLPEESVIAIAPENRDRMS